MDDSLREEVREFLNDLRKSGSTNMFGAAPHLEQQFGFTRSEARDALLYWMKNFTRSEARDALLYRMKNFTEV